MSNFSQHNTGANQTILREYPLPIANVYYRYNCLKPQDYGSRHKLLIDLFEATAKFICIVCLQEMQARVPDFKERLPSREESLEFLKHPSIGEFIGFLRTVTQLDLSDVGSKLLWTPIVRSWLIARKSNSSQEILAKLKSIEGLNFNSRSQTPHLELFNVLVTYRNKQIAHGASFREEALKTRIEILESTLLYLLESMHFCVEMSLIYTEEARRLPDDREEIAALQLRGVNQERLAFITTEKVELSELYLLPESSNSDLSMGVALTPFLLWQTNRKTEHIEIFYFNDAQRTKLEYLSYASGDRYFHTELHERFRNIINLDLRNEPKELEVVALSDEERAAKHDFYYRNAMQVIDGHRLEDGAEFLEYALNFQRSPETLLELARTQYSLNDPKNAIQHTLEGCLEIDPENAGALDLLRTLETGKVIEKTDRFENLTYFHLFCPRTLYDYCPVWICTLLFVYYSISIFADYKHGESLKFMFVTSTGWLITAVWVIGVFLARSKVNKMYYSLAAQLDSTRLDRFRDWYENAIIDISGSFPRFSSQTLLGTLKANRNDWPYLLLFLVGWAGTVIASGAYVYPMSIFLKRLLDFVFPVLTGVICLKLTLGVIRFVIGYSRHPIKPMITTINDHGLRALGELFAVSILSEVAGIVICFSATFSINQGPVFVNLFIAAIVLMSVLSYSIGMPIVVYNAARAGKGRAAMQYAEKMESCFNDFLKNPNEENLQTYTWLKKNQRVVKNIRSWPMTPWQTYGVVVGANLFLLFLGIRFILIQVKELDVWSVRLASVLNDLVRKETSRLCRVTLTV